VSFFNDEVEFLKRFGKRFKTKETYLNALNDLYKEGLISKKALDEIKRLKNKNKATKKPIKKDAAKVEQFVDPCSRNYRISPC
jgi:hypothetical protein